MSSKGNFLRRYIILGFIAAVALPVTTWEGFYIHQAHAAVEITPNSQTSNSFANNAQLLYTLKGHNGTVKSLAFSPDSKILVSGGAENEGVIRVWNPVNGKN
ncbi:MAG: WD40 repeat domain-containing protein, partial [Nostoc sp.]